MLRADTKRTGLLDRDEANGIEFGDMARLRYRESITPCCESEFYAPHSARSYRHLLRGATEDWRTTS